MSVYRQGVSNDGASRGAATLLAKCIEQKLPCVVVAKMGEAGVLYNRMNLGTYAEALCLLGALTEMTMAGTKASLDDVLRDLRYLIAGTGTPSTRECPRRRG